MIFRSKTANDATITYLTALQTAMGDALNAHVPPTSDDLKEVAKIANTIEAVAKAVSTDV